MFTTQEIAKLYKSYNLQQKARAHSPNHTHEGIFAPRS